MLGMFRTINHRTALTWSGQKVAGATGAVTSHNVKKHAQYAFALFLCKHVSIRTLKDRLQPEMPSRDHVDRLAWGPPQIFCKYCRSTWAASLVGGVLRALHFGLNALCESSKPWISHPRYLLEQSWHNEEDQAGERKKLYLHCSQSGILLPQDLCLKGEGKKFSFTTFNEKHFLFPSHPAPETAFTEVSVCNFFFCGFTEEQRSPSFHQ